MKNIHKIFLVLFTATSVLTGCDLDINDDPNRVTDKTVTGDLIFPAAAHGVGARVASPNFSFINNWLGYWSASGTFAIDAEETSYNITTDFVQGFPWRNHYNVLFDLEQAKIKSLASGDSSVAGASIILEAMLWQELTDIYGNIPYSQALQYAKYPRPTYDKGQDIYNDLQDKLDLAITCMEATPKSTFPTVDIVNGGDTEKWIKFANTLKLRLLIRQSEIPGFDHATEIAKIVAKGGVLQSGETVSVNPGYANATNKQSPFYGNFGKTVNDADAATNTRANVYFVEMLNANADPRLFQYFVPVGNNVVGTVYGLSAGNPQIASSVGGPGLANSADQDQWIFTSVESLFLEAEAIERGWITDGPDAADAYAAAVTESFLFLEVEDAQDEAATYLTDHAYTGDINKLILQKYVALAGIAPIQIWSDLRRLSYDGILPGPVTPGHNYISVNPSKVSNTVPVRLLYPQSEYTSNADNANAQGAINQFTSRIFWDVN